MGYLFDAMNRPSERPEFSPEAPEVFPDIPGEIPGESASPAVVHEQLDPQEKPGKVDDRLVMLTNPATLMAEEYRAIRTSILARWEQKQNLIHTITSATPQEGKTITSLNLGLCFAELRSRSTLVIECDLRLPQFAKLLNMPHQPGVVDHLRDGLPLEKVIQRPAGSSLHVIAAGPCPGNETVQLLSSQRMAALLKQLKRQYDHIIIDTPPVVSLADAGILGAMSDEVLLVARMGRTPRMLVEQAIRTLHSYHAPVSGVIATDQTRPRREHYYQRYGYYYTMQGRAQAA